MLKFEACACGLHGRFRTTRAAKAIVGGKPSVEFVASGHEVATKEDALAFIRTAEARGVISDAFAEDLRRAVAATAMAGGAEGADPAVLTAARDWNLQLATTTDPRAFLAARPEHCLVRAPTS